MNFKLLGILLFVIPKKCLSHWVGWFVHKRLPGPLGPWSVRFFAKSYRLNLDEAELPLESYPTISSLFTRRLKPKCRPIDDRFAVHSCDAVITQTDILRPDILVQAKSKDFTIEELLKEPELSKRFLHGVYVTYYLCPTDYHRVHSPVDGKVMSSIIIPGNLWPVNEWSVTHIDKLFAVNERVVTCIQTVRGIVAVVMIGATNVGNISVSYDPKISTNRLGMKKSARTYHPQIPIAKGEELGVFHMGSTVITLFEKGVLRSGEVPKGKVHFGTALDF